MCKTNENKVGFLKILLHRFANQIHRSIFAPSFTVPKKEIFRNSTWSVRLGVRTPDFHSGNTGSIPVRTTKIDATN